MEIRAYNRKGLELLWNRVSSGLSTDATLEAIYRTYGKEQWETKCFELGFKSPTHSEHSEPTNRQKPLTNITRKTNNDTLIGKKFKLSTVPQEVIDAGTIEGNTIWNSNYSQKNALSGKTRTKDDIIKDAILGKCGEYLIKKHFDYIEDTEKWHDLISPEGVRTEIKTWRKSTLTKRMIDDQVRKISSRKLSDKKWFFSTKMIVIVYDEALYEYEIEGIYDI